jgi:nucleotidyltransferase substrate binding protein (TIGR01987 family)
MTNDKIKQKLSNFKKALARFETALKAPIDADQLIIEASIQCFEFSYELSWKLLKDVLEKEGLQANTPREIFRQAYSAYFISDEKIWLDMLNDRNMTSYVYHKKIAVDIYERLKIYFPVLTGVFHFIKDKYAQSDLI